MQMLRISSKKSELSVYKAIHSDNSTYANVITYGRKLTAKLYVFESFINFNDNPLSTLVLKARSSKSCRKWKVTLSIITILTCKEERKVMVIVKH
jgi:hypothetical protein